MSRTPPDNAAIDLAAIRAQLAGKRGKQYWRSLDELARTPEFQHFVDNEFPAGPQWHDDVSRRRFLQLMGASLALAGLHGCGERPAEPIVPYVRQPEAVTPGIPLYFATAHTLGGFARGLLVESHTGRPTKVEGNPLHPASPGPADAQSKRYPYAPADIFAQASLLTLYDPERSQTMVHLGRISTWDAFSQTMRNALRRLSAQGGAGLRILTPTVTSPTLAWQLATVQERLPEARWHQYEPVNRDLARRAAVTAFGRDLAVRYRFDQAAVVLSLGSDFLTTGPAAMRYAHDFMNRRRVLEGTRTMNRLYAVEPTPTNTGAVADHRLPLSPDAMEHLAEALAAQLTGAGDATAIGLPTGVSQAWFDAVVEDLTRNRGTCIVIAGEQSPMRVQVLAHLINETLGNVGQTVEYTEPVVANSVDQTESLRDLAEAMHGGRVELLIMLGGNPVYDAPADVQFLQALQRVPLRVHQSLYRDETSFHCQWHVAAAHELESWGDARAFDGTVTILQPLIAPLYENRTAHEVLAVLLDQPGQSSYRIVRNFWSQMHGNEQTFESFWRRALHDGVVQGTRLEPVEASLQLPRELLARRSRRRDPSEQVLILRSDPTVYDGRYANNGWLQELPKPVTKITWDNAALISPRLAQELGVRNGQMLELTVQGRTQRAAAWITPGQCDNCVTLHLGYGRTRAGNVGNGLGFNAYTLRTADAMWHAQGLTIRTLSERYELARTQHHQSLEGRPIFQELTFAQFMAGMFTGDDHSTHPHVPLSLYEPFEHTGTQWGMTIDLTACIGCQACMIACQSENNIPVVGKDQVQVGREMHWIRVDAYFEGQLDNPDTHFQPVTCMHCEKAPCEAVCPVGATMHSDDGLNEMVYNRCIGTRYCSNNCPYKVRRFNFLQYVDPTIESHRLMRNPNVTVRSRGVMEKCTYCVQRIRRTGIDARRQNRPIRDDEVITACQSACPTQAIIFGDINNPDSRVARYKKQPHDYGMLEELNTQPRTSYLARVRNPHPRLAGDGSTMEGERAEPQ